MKRILTDKSGNEWEATEVESAVIEPLHTDSIVILKRRCPQAIITPMHRWIYEELNCGKNSWSAEYSEKGLRKMLSIMKELHTYDSNKSCSACQLIKDCEDWIGDK